MATRQVNIALRSAYELLPLGTSIEYHHRAAPARHQRMWQPHETDIYGRYKPEPIPRGWKLKEGVYKNELIPEGMGEGTTDEGWYGPDAEYVSIRWHTEEFGKGVFASLPKDHEERVFTAKDMFFNWPQAKHHTWRATCNKTVMVWPAEGSGVITGIIRKAIGSSEPGYTSGYEYPEYNPPYFSQYMYIDLYVVKERYEGTEYILCPLWGVKEIDNEG